MPVPPKQEAVGKYQHTVRTLPKVPSSPLKRAGHHPTTSPPPTPIVAHADIARYIPLRIRNCDGYPREWRACEQGAALRSSSCWSSSRLLRRSLVCSYRLFRRPGRPPIEFFALITCTKSAS